jgi:hypothetical protein
MMHQSLSKPIKNVKSSHRILKFCLNPLGSSHLRGHCRGGAQGNYKYAVVAVEYFTKWIELKHLVNIAATGLRRFFLAEHNMSFQCTQRDNSRQCQAIQLPLIQGFQSPVGGRISLHIRVSSSVQWSSGKSECIDIHGYKEDIREPAERQMGRRAAESCMESQHLCLQSNKIHPFQADVR